MASKSDKEKSDKGEADLKKSAASAKKTTPKSAPKKAKDEDDDDDLDDDVEDTDTPKAAPKKGAKAPAAKGKKKDEDEDDDDDAPVEDEVDEWDKVEEEEEWDPDFDEFDVPRSKSKKGPVAGGTKKPGKEEDELGLDDDFKSNDLFNDSGFEEEEDDF